MKPLNRTTGPTPGEGVDPVRGDTRYTPCRTARQGTGKEDVGRKDVGQVGQKEGMTEPWYLSSMNFLTSGEVRSLASFFTRGSFSLPFFTARKLP